MLINELAKRLVKNYNQTDIVGGLFPKGFVTVVASKSGVGKTWLMLKMSCDLTVGGDICGGLAVHEPPRKVIIMSGETGEEFLGKRYAATEWPRNIEKLIIYENYSLAAAHYNMMLNEDDGKCNFETIMQTENPDIIFIDTLISFHRGDENVAKDMADVFGFLQKLAGSYNCAVVVMHHVRKAARIQKKTIVDQDEVIGSSATNRLAGVVYVITKNDRSGSFPINIVTNVKNWGENVPQFSYSIRNIGGVVDLVFDTVSVDNVNTSVRYKLSQFVETRWSLGDEYSLRQLSEILHIGKDLLRKYVDEYVINKKLSFREVETENKRPKYLYRLIDM